MGKFIYIYASGTEKGNEYIYEKVEEKEEQSIDKNERTYSRRVVGDWGKFHYSQTLPPLL